MIYIYIDGIPSSTNNIQLNHSYTPSSTMSVCRSINQFSDGVKVESEKVNNLLNALQQYYSEIKTRRQLNFEVPVGFRQKNQYQKMCHDAHIYHLSQSDPPAYDTSIDDSSIAWRLSRSTSYA
jgi:pyoverdine/dityrosine biosynthesis protein Dit1